MNPEADRPKSSFKLLYWALALAFAGILLYYSLRGIDWADVWRVVSGADARLLLLALALSSFSLLLRALRWRVLLRAGAPVTLPTAFWALAAGYFGNNFLPARAGEVIRSLMVSSASGLSKTFVLTTALSERLCDAIALVVISSVILLSMPVKPGWFAHAATPFAILGLCGAAGIAILPRIQSFCHRCLQIMPIPIALKSKLTGVLDQILIGLRTLHDPSRLASFVGLTAVIWFSDAVGTVMGMRALGLSGTISLALLLITGLGLASALPSTPGYVGIYQFVAVSVLTPFGFSKTNAIAYILVNQALQYILMTFWGGIGMVRARSVKLKLNIAENTAPAPSVLRKI